MKRNMHILFAALMIFALTACQTATASPTAVGTPGGPHSVDVYKNQPDYWLTISLPADWTAHIGGTSLAKNVTITDDWKGYQASDGKAVGIIVTWLKLTDKSSAEDALQGAIKRLDRMLRQRVGEVTLEEANGQSYASVEYEGKSFVDGVSDAHYFVAVVSNGKRNILVMSSVEKGQETRVKPVFQDVMKGVVVH
jgi:hypothetical protein